MSTHLELDSEAGAKSTLNTASKIIITGEHLALTDALKHAVISKCEKLFHHSKDIIHIKVVLGSDGSHKPTYFAKGVVSIYGPDLVVSATNPDLYTAISQLAQKLDRQLRAKHGKRVAKRHSKT
jgi:putative sigma-54 modulation protein